MKIDFYHLDNESIHISMNLILEDGELRFEGYDYGENVEKFRGMGDDFEYSLSLDKENTIKVFEALGISDKPDEEKLQYIKYRFSKDKSFSGFEDFCDENNIKTSYFSWP